MCEPASMLAVATFALSAAGTVASYAQGQAQQQAQVDYQQAQAQAYADAATQNNIAANQELVEKMAAERVGEMQDKESATAQIINTKKEAMEKKGTMLASSNAAGGALDYLMADFDRQEAENTDAIMHQFEMSKDARNINMKSSQLQAQNRVDSQQGYIMQSSGSNGFLDTLGLGIGLGSAALGAYNAYDKHSKP